jgi:hypothetical protein
VRELFTIKKGLAMVFILGLAGSGYAENRQDPKGLLWTDEIAGQSQEMAAQTCKDMGARLPLRLDYEIAQRHGLWSAIGMKGVEWTATSVNAEYQRGAYSTSATLEVTYDKYSDHLDHSEAPSGSEPGVRCVFDHLGLNASKTIDSAGSYKNVCGVVHWVSEVYKNECGTSKNNRIAIGKKLKTPRQLFPL